MDDWRILHQKKAQKPSCAVDHRDRVSLLRDLVTAPCSVSLDRKRQPPTMPLRDIGSTFNGISTIQAPGYAPLVSDVVVEAGHVESETVLLGQRA